MNSKQRQANKHREFKAKAEKEFGRAAQRPQESIPGFVQQRRAILYTGSVEDLLNPRRKDVMEFLPNNLHLVTSSEEKPLEKPVCVDTTSEFEVMLKDLETSTEFIIDLEGHEDDSYEPFTACMQITAPQKKDYLIWVPKLYENIRKKLVPLLMRDDVVVVGFAIDGDLTSLQYEFGLFPIAAFCLQAFHVNLHHLKQKPSYVNTLNAFVPELVPDHMTVEWKKMMQAADWTNWPYAEAMKTYAQGDIYYLKAAWTKVKLMYSTSEIYEKGIKPMKQVLAANLSKPSSPDTFEKCWGHLSGLQSPRVKKLMASIKLSPEKYALCRTLWEYRQIKARNFDIAPRLLMSFESVVRLAAQMPQNINEIDIALLGSVYDGSKVELFKRTLLNVIKNGQPVIERMKKTPCHRCGEIGHVAPDCKRFAEPGDKRRFVKADPLLYQKSVDMKIVKYNEKLIRQGRSPVTDVNGLMAALAESTKLKEERNNARKEEQRKLEERRRKQEDHRKSLEARRFSHLQQYMDNPVPKLVPYVKQQPLSSATFAESPIAAVSSATVTIPDQAEAKFQKPGEVTHLVSKSRRGRWNPGSYGVQYSSKVAASSQVPVRLSGDPGLENPFFATNGPIPYGLVFPFEGEDAQNPGYSGGFKGMRKNNET